MRRRCSTCLCRTCLKHCKCRECKGKVDACENYKGFSQICIFEQKNNPFPAAPRRSWAYYGISKDRYKTLTEYIRAGKYASLALQAANTANETVSGHVLLSVKKNLSYEGLERMWGRGEIDRIPYGRTDFYGIRRMFYHLLDLELRRIGK